MFRLDRSRKAGPLLEWKVRIFVVAASLGLAGILMDERWLTGAAILVLTGGVLVRLKREDPTDDSPDSQGGSEDDPT